MNKNNYIQNNNIIIKLMLILIILLLPSYYIIGVEKVSNTDQNVEKDEELDLTTGISNEQAEDSKEIIEPAAQTNEIDTGLGMTNASSNQSNIQTNEIDTSLGMTNASSKQSNIQSTEIDTSLGMTNTLTNQQEQVEDKTLKKIKESDIYGTIKDRVLR